MVFFRALPLLLIAAVGLCPMAPPEHLHEGTDADGHHHQVAHRHAMLHVTHEGPGHRAVAPDGHGEEAVHVEEADHDHIVTLDAVFTTPMAVTSLGAPATDVIRLPAPPRSLGALPPSFVEPLIHGPPRASPDLRGPPLSFL